MCDRLIAGANENNCRGDGVKNTIRFVLDNTPYIGVLREQIRELRRKVEKEGQFAAGHFYSPIPEKDDVLAYLDSRKSPAASLPGIDLNEESQRALLNEYFEFYADLPFPVKQNTESRYYYENHFFSYSDAIFLYSFLRKHQPKRIIEVGSGFSSAVMLDTVDGFYSQRPEMTFIEPYPERLNALLRKDDQSNVTVLERRLQDVPLDLFSSLQAGDFLFIDSSHVMKCGSDLHWLFYEILPMLAGGVIVHFHDVFYPFDYPDSWLRNGRYWNENYMLRAFLSYNSEWSIYYFNTYVALMFRDFLKEKMPLCERDFGGSLYIKKRLES